MTLTDDELLDAFESGSIGDDDFPHARHVRVAWLLARKYGRAEGFERLATGIQGIARRAGRPDAYHVTITRAWFELIAPVADPGHHPELMDKSLLGRYYSSSRLAAGRERWLEPDVHPLRLPAPPRAKVDPFRALRRIPSPVAVLATAAGGTVHATTVGTLAFVSRDPALVSVSLAEGSRTLEVLGDAAAFTLSVLGSGHAEHAVRFSDRSRPSGAEQFAGVPHHLTEFGPALDDAVVRLGCRMHARHRCGDHTLVIGAVCSAEDDLDVHPLVQHDGAYH
ncbi:MAG TPA: flavin reductase family protein [Gaiellaceae bacterium]|jgi:flavin reductase (DIM6/NTAB) family NADH-FMN oxidoreductase RutF|nr:flavin reductase family protein [Gaiellaceae bacterium]